MEQARLRRRNLHDQHDSPLKRWVAETLASRVVEAEERLESLSKQGATPESMREDVLLVTGDRRLADAVYTQMRKEQARKRLGI